MLIGDDRGDVAQQPSPIVGDDQDLDGVALRRRLAPRHVDDPGTIRLAEAEHVAAIAAVDGDTSAASDVADDVVRRHRLAATRHGRQQIAHAVHGEQSLDEERYRQYWTVRKPGSIWSKINKDKIAALTAAELMHPAGIAAVERAKADGSWTILDGPEAGIVPADFAEAMDQAGVRSTFDGFSRSKRKSILGWLAMAKREATRTDRMAKTIEALERGETPMG